MNKSLAIGLLIGAAGGLIAGAIVAKSKAVSTPPPPTVVAVPPPAPSPDPELKDEIARLRKRVAELEAAAAPAPPPPPPAPPFGEAPAKPADPEPAKAESVAKILEDFAKLGKKGLGAYMDPALKKLAERVKSGGPEALAAILDRLARAETGSERFVAAALLESVGNPEAFPGLSKAMMNDDDVLVRRMSSHAIAMIGTEAALAPLRGVMESTDDWGVRVNAAYGVAAQKQEDGVKWLVDFYEAESSPKESKGPVLGALASLGAPSTAPIFRALLKEATDVGYQLLAIGALEAMKDQASVAELTRISTTSTYSSNVREAAKKAVETLSK